VSTGSLLQSIVSQDAYCNVIFGHCVYRVLITKHCVTECLLQGNVQSLSHGVLIARQYSVIVLRGAYCKSTFSHCLAVCLLQGNIQSLCYGVLIARQRSVIVLRGAYYKATFSHCVTMYLLQSNVQSLTHGVLIARQHSVIVSRVLIASQRSVIVSQCAYCKATLRHCVTGCLLQRNVQALCHGVLITRRRSGTVAGRPLEP
jgi:hypothetical protein